MVDRSTRIKLVKIEKEGWQIGAMRRGETEKEVVALLKNNENYS